MLKIPRQQVLDRWDALPDNLKEALFSESNSNIVWQIGTLNHLPEEKISMMATIVGDVIFGFLHPDDLAREIQETLNLNPQIANSISREINRKIFSPIKLELEKNYNPVAEPTEPAKPAIETKPQEPVFKPAESLSSAAPKPVEITELPATKPVQPPKTETKPIIPQTPISTEKPFVIHQEAETKTFTGKKKTIMPIMGWFKKESSKAPESPVKVELETFGQKIEEKKEPAVAKTETQKQRMVHYRDVEIPTPFGKPFNEIQNKPETRPLKEIPPQKIETPVVRPLNETQSQPEPPKPMAPITPATPITKQPEPAAKPAGPAVINLDSFSVSLCQK